MNFGKLMRIETPEEADVKFAELKAAGYNSLQIIYKPEVYDVSTGAIVKAAAEKHGLVISAMFCGYYDTETVLDNYYGHLTCGINVDAFKLSRIQYVKEAAKWAAAAGIEDVIIHAGWIPLSPWTHEYASMCASVRSMARHCQKLGLNLLLETGQETPISLLRLIEDVGTGNVFVNLDPANLMMYGCGNAVDAVDVFGKYVRNVHGKDGCVPTEPRKLGKETVVGEGMVDFRAMLQKLKNLGYDRFITIEREAAVNDTQRQLDAMHAKNYLENIWNSLD